jgi:ketosteroid isomerase-like protein
MAETLPAGVEKLHQDDVAATLTRDLEALAALWDDDGVLLQPGQCPIIGKTAFRGFLKQPLAQSASAKGSEICSRNPGCSSRRLHSRRMGLF